MKAVLGSKESRRLAQTFFRKGDTEYRVAKGIATTVLKSGHDIIGIRSRANEEATFLEILRNIPQHALCLRKTFKTVMQSKLAADQVKLYVLVPVVIPSPLF